MTAAAEANPVERERNETPQKYLKELRELIGPAGILRLSPPGKKVVAYDNRNKEHKMYGYGDEICIKFGDPEDLNFGPDSYPCNQEALITNLQIELKSRGAIHFDTEFGFIAKYKHRPDMPPTTFYYDYSENPENHMAVLKGIVEALRSWKEREQPTQTEQTDIVWA